MPPYLLEAATQTLVIPAAEEEIVPDRSDRSKHSKRRHKSKRKHPSQSGSEQSEDEISLISVLTILCPNLTHQAGPHLVMLPGFSGYLPF